MTDGNPTWENPSATRRQQILRATRTVAVVGASPNPARASNFVATYLLASTDYDVYFVNPNATEILGRPVYKTLADLPLVPDLVDVFRRREDLPAVLDDVLALDGVRAFWLQFGLYDEDVARSGRGRGPRGRHGPLPQGRARPLPRRPAHRRLRHGCDQLTPPRRKLILNGQVG